MRLIFVRHGDPDYTIDNLTEKGKREVELLTKRICSWENITDFYTSPLGRAKATGAPALEKMGRTAEVCNWLQEFDASRWDLMPDFYNSNKNFFNKEKWANTAFMKEHKIKEKYKEVCDGIDSLLKKYGYIRNSKNYYNVKNPAKNHNWNEPIYKYHLKSIKDDYPEETTLVFFCHLGIMFTIIAHLTGLSPMQLWQGFYVAPTSITILNSEERKEGEAWFRVERLGDTNHLTNGGEPISSSGYFATVFDETKKI
ncbi:MAG: histidine phosphatase family protein [Treponema sp.]|nr:histidine phosphatase family protein [Treponema sp.]